MQKVNTSDFFEFLTGKSPDVVIVLDVNFNCVYVNAAIAKFTGIKKEDLEGKPLSENKIFGSPELPYYPFLHEALNSKKRINTDCSIQTLTGEMFFHIYIIPKNAGDTIENLFIIFRDMSEIKSKEKLLNEFNNKFLTAAEVLLQPLVILRPVFENNILKDFEYEYINETGSIVNGIPRESTIGRTILELFPFYKPLGVFDALSEVYTTGIPWKDVIKYDGPAGSGILNGYFNMSAARTVDGIVVTWQDITQSVNAQDDLKKSEERLYKAFNSNPVPMVLADQDGKIININKSFRKLLSYSKKEVAKKSTGEINLFEDPADFRNVAESIAYGSSIDKYFTKIRDRNGTIFQVIFSSTPLVTPGTAYYLLTFVDITKQKELETSLLDSIQEKDVLLKEIHHRVKNNLQIISSLLNLQSGVTEDLTARSIISETQNRVQSIALMHENLYKNKSLSAIKLDDYVKDMLNRIQQTYEFPGKVITSSIQISNINLDLKQCLSVGLILNELITNSYKYGFINRKRGEIRICANLKGRYLELTVADDGNGLPAGFDINSQNSLGLQLVSILTNQLNGSIKFTNKAGAEFKILFPFQD